MRKALLVGVLAILILAAAGSAVSAQDGGDKFVFGENFVLHSGEVLSGNLAVLGGTATLEQGSTVQGDVAVAGGKLILGGAVKGSAAVLGGTAVLEETAVIEGDFASFGGTAAVAPGATIKGESFGGGRFAGPSLALPELPSLPLAPQPPVRPRTFGGLGEIVSWQLETIGWALMLVLLGVIAVLLAPKPLARISEAASTQPALSLGAGLLTFVVGVMAGALLLIACCLGVFVWLALLIAIAVGWIAVGLWVGERLLSALKVRDASVLAEVALGVLLITVLGRLPLCLGTLFTAAVGSVGLGAVVLTRFGRQPIAPDSAVSAAPASRTLEDLDAEVLAPLGLPSGEPAPSGPGTGMAGEITPPEPTEEPSASQIVPPSGPDAGAQPNPAAPVDEAGGIVPQPAADEPPLGDNGSQPVGRSPDQPNP
jgi:hypothetical protein